MIKIFGLIVILIEKLSFVCILFEYFLIGW